MLPPKSPLGVIRFTKFTASPDATLTKSFSLTSAGSIAKTGQPNFSDGSAETVEIQDLLELPDLLDGLKQNQCISTGIFDTEKCLIVPSGTVPKNRESEAYRSRTKREMQQPVPGLLLFDYDPSEYMQETLRCSNVEELIARLETAIPELLSVGYVGAGSSSSGIFREDNGGSYAGGGGFHVYIVVNTSDLEALRDWFEVKLWLAGLGYIALARNGARLKRTIVDLAVFSQERLIYEAAPILCIGLNREARRWAKRQGIMLDFKPVLSEEERTDFQAKVQTALNEPGLKEKADQIYVAYRQIKVSQLSEFRGISTEAAETLIPPLSPEERESRELRLTENDTLEIKGQLMSVEALLARGEELDGTPMPDPIEGNAYGLTTAKFYYNDGINPCIHSFAHGAKTVYRLSGETPIKPATTILTVRPSGSFSVSPPEPLDPGTFPHQRLSSHGEIRLVATIQNIAHLLAGYGIRVEYNVISKKLRISMPGMQSSPENALNVAMSKIISLATLNSISTGSIPSYISTIADHHQVNEVADWITQAPWDGEDRVPAIVATLTTREDFPYELKRTLIYCWLLSAVAAALLPSGFFARGVLTLQGPQGLGKTSWIRRLVTPTMLQDTTVLLSHHLDAGHKDSVITAVSHWIVELGELDSSFKKDIARLKGFITGASDKVRRPYAMADSEYQRRTVFCATVNEENFLVDTTGNSRWWTLPVTAIDYQHNVDMQQLFAQLAVDLHNGAQWWLTSQQEVLLAEQNRQHRAVNVIEEKLLSTIDPSPSADQPQALSSTEVLQRLGYDKPSNPQCRECGSILREYFGEPKKINGTMKWRVPLRKRFPALGE